jgi:hypothetical protein
MSNIRFYYGKNIGEQAEDYDISRRRHVDRAREEQARRAERELLNLAADSKSMARKSPVGFGKNADWIHAGLSFIPGVGVPLALLATIRHENEKRKQSAENISDIHAMSVPSWAKGTWLENYYKKTSNEIKQQAANEAMGIKKAADMMGFFNIGLQALPMGSKAFKKAFPGTKAATKGGTTAVAKASKGVSGFIDSLISGKLGGAVEGVIDTATTPVFEKGLFPNFRTANIYKQPGAVKGFDKLLNPFIQNIGKQTTLTHLSQPLLKPLQDLLVNRPGETLLSGVQAPKLPRRRF